MSSDRSSNELLADLTEPQRAAVVHERGPLLIVAGAGSGKTRVLTRRVAQLIRNGARPSSILAITFTNKAAGEMRHRIADVIGRRIWDFGRLDQPSPMVCTFHSLCLRILKQYATRIGLPPNFLIYDTSDQNKLIKEALKALEISSGNFQPSAIHGTIGQAKNQMLTASDYAKRAGDFYEKVVARVYVKYEQMLESASALDFDDLLMKSVFALRDHPDILSELQDRFAYLLIDEYQDTNRAQYLLSHALAARHRNICVVGDPDQSIYAWRGADLRNILDFERDYPDVAVVKLEQNYRSTQTILHIASRLISRNLARKEKSLWTRNDPGEKASVILCQDEHDEAAQIEQIVRDMHEQEGFDWSRIAIFYRINSLSRVIEDALRRAGIPYQIARGVEFYNRREIKDLLGYLRVVANPRDEVSLERIVNTPTRGISDGTYKQLQAWAVVHGVGVFEAMRHAGQITDLNTRAQRAVLKFVESIDRWRHRAGIEVVTGGAVACEVEEVGHASSSAAGSMFSEFEDPIEDVDRVESTGSIDSIDSIESVESDADKVGSNPLDSKVSKDGSVDGRRSRVKALMESILRESGLEAMYRKLDPDLDEQVSNLNELVSAAAEFDEGNPDGSLSEYLAGVALVSDADHMEGAGGAVTLMTLHAAKGLEFPVVIMAGLEEGVLPHARARGNVAELEEERRLCFVGITRARERLFLTGARYRTIRGLRERTTESPFLRELPEESIVRIDRGAIDFEDHRQIRSIEAASDTLASRFRTGQTVRHPQFGTGRIADLSSSGSQTRAVVEFQRVGRKTLILDFARLEVA